MSFSLSIHQFFYIEDLGFFNNVSGGKSFSLTNRAPIDLTNPLLCSVHCIAVPQVA